MSEHAARALFFGAKLTQRQYLTRWAWLSLPPIGIFSVLATLFLSGAFSSSEPVEERPRILPALVEPVGSAGPDFLVQSYTGVVAPRRRSMLASKAVGRVELIAVDLGDRIEQGAEVVRLDSAQLLAQREVTRASWQAAKARLEELQRGPRRQEIERARSSVDELQANLQLEQSSFRRFEQLRASDAISQQEYDERVFALNAVRAQLASAQEALDQLVEGTRPEQISSQQAIVGSFAAQMQRIEADLNDRSVIAPFAGQVLQRVVDEGTIVSPGQALLEIVEDRPYEVRVGLPLEVADQLEPSNLSLVVAGQSLSATIDRKAPAIADVTRTREVVFLLSEESSTAVTIGQAVELRVNVPADATGMWVPSRALTAGPRGLWEVFLAVPASEVKDAANTAPNLNLTADEDHHVVVARQVELLRADGEWSEIRGPVEPDSQLIVEGVHKLSPGQWIQPIRATDSTQLSQSR